MKISNTKHVLEVDDADLSGSVFRDVKLARSSFIDADLSEASFEDINLQGATFRNINFSGVGINDCNLTGTRINGIPVQDALDAYQRRAWVATPAEIERSGGTLIRPYQEADEAAVISLWKRVFGYTDPHNDPATVIRLKLQVDRELFVVAMQGTSVVGTVMGGYDGHRGWIYSLAVDDRHRHRGIATALVTHVEHALILRGCLKINLQILASNAATASFYEKLGYRVEERVSMGKLVK